MPQYNLPPLEPKQTSSSSLVKLNEEDPFLPLFSLPISGFKTNGRKNPYQKTVSICPGCKKELPQINWLPQTLCKKCLHKRTNNQRNLQYKIKKEQQKKLLETQKK